MLLPEVANSIAFAAMIASLLSAGIYLLLRKFGQSSLMPNVEHVAFFGATSVVASWLLLLGYAWSTNFDWKRRHHLLTRMFVGALIGLSTFALAQFFLVETPFAAYAASNSAFSTLRNHPLIDDARNPTRFGYVCFFAVWLGFRSWSRDMNPYRRKRLSVTLAASASVMAYVTSLIFPFPQWYAILWALTISATVQLASPWNPKRLSADVR